MPAAKFWIYRHDGLNKKRKYDVILLPVPPSSIDFSEGNDIQSVDLQEAGEIILKKRRKLRTCTISGMLPSHLAKYNFILKDSRAQTMELWELIEKIRTFMTGNYPLSIMTEHTHMGTRNTYLSCYLESFTYSAMSDGSNDVQYSMTFKEYRSKVPRPISVPKTYKTKSGDTCTTVAKKFYGASVEWRKVYDKNRSKIGSNPNKIKTGTVLSL